MFETLTYNDPRVLDPLVRGRWKLLETSSACAVMASAAPTEWADIVDFLSTFELDANDWLQRGGNRGLIPEVIDGFFQTRGWQEIRVDLETRGVLLGRKKGEVVEELPVVRQEGYLVDNFRGRVALDVEWNAKDGNLDRDLSAYRAWHEAGVISAGVIITKERESLLSLAEAVWGDYQSTLRDGDPNISSKLPIDLGTSTTTSFDKAEIRVNRGVMGTCPLLIVGVNSSNWNRVDYLGPSRWSST